MATRKMTLGEIDSVRFAARCAYRAGREVAVAVREAWRDWGNYDNVAWLVREEYSALRYAGVPTDDKRNAVSIGDTMTGECYMAYSVEGCRDRIDALAYKLALEHGTTITIGKVVATPGEGEVVGG